MEYEDVLIREAVGDGTIDPDDVCMVCDKRDCICPPEQDETQQGENHDYGMFCECSECTGRLDAEIDRQRALGYETFDDYVARTGFPRDEASYAAYIGEGKWMLTSQDKPL